MPIVGLAIGALAGACAIAVGSIAPPAFVIATAFGATIVLSGAVHVDGFLDSCDALVASVSPERRLAIMQDPRHGTFALAGFAVIAAFWIAALATLASNVLPWALAFSGATARLAAILNAFAVPYGRAGASALAFERRPPIAVLALAAIGIVACCVLARHPWWLVAVPLACCGSLAIGTIAARRLGGVLVGDVYGATIVVLEVALLSAITVRGGH